MKKVSQIKQMEQMLVSSTCNTLRVLNDEEGFKTISDMWNKFFQTYIGEGPIVAVYTNYASDETGAYDFYIGTVQNDISEPTLTLAEGKYFVIEIDADSPEEMQAEVGKAWQEIWCNTDLKRTFVADYELYASPTSVMICVGLAE